MFELVAPKRRVTQHFWPAQSGVSSHFSVPVTSLVFVQAAVWHFASWI